MSASHQTTLSLTWENLNSYIVNTDHYSLLAPWDRASGCARGCALLWMSAYVCGVECQWLYCVALCPPQDVCALGLVKLRGYTVEETADSKKQL